MSFSNVPQTMLWLAFTAGAGDTTPYTKDCETATYLYGVIQDRLATLNSEYSQSWAVVWGPAIFSFPINLDGRHVDNAVYVVRNGSSNDYAIAIAGTDPLSLADWVFEDFLVGITVPWLLESGFEPRPRISLATFNGLTILLNLTPPCAPIPGTGQKLIPFLSTITGSPINLYTTGHSLGGALAPTLTLALADLRILWDLAGNATLFPYAFAGPTPGDAAFAQYFNQKIPGGLQRIWNALDVVPHAWDTEQMNELPTLYGNAIADVTDLVNDILPAIEPIGYTQLNAEAATFSGPLQGKNISNLIEYLLEAGWQHVEAYLKWAGQEHWPNGIPQFTP